MMEKAFKLKFLGYLLISAASFSYLVLPQNAGVSVPIFVMIQFICLCFLAPKKKPLLMFIPIFILASNSFISANEIWRVPNLFVSLALYSVMTLMMADRFPIKEVSLKFMTNTLENILEPLRYFSSPVKWSAEAGKDNAQTIKRVFIGIGISIPCLIFLLIMLSSADAIFSNNVSLIFESIGLIFTFIYIIKPKFNIAAIYLAIGMTYYLLLNIVPIDRIIAKDQIDRYLVTGDGGIAYVLTLSPDAAPEIVRLFRNADERTSDMASDYFKTNIEQYNSTFLSRWQRWNLSVDRLQNLCDK